MYRLEAAAKLVSYDDAWLAKLSDHTGEKALGSLGVAANGAAAANALGLTTQVPVRSIYLTSGRSRTINVGSQKVELKHVPCWQLSLANRSAGVAVRALAWLGPERAEDALFAIRRKLAPEAFNELVAAAPQFPNWLARSVGMVTYD
nr:DUF6088 family protein [Peteryoungia desertarenae]